MGDRNTINVLYQQRTFARDTSYFYGLLYGTITKVAMVPFAVVQWVCKYVGDKVGNRIISVIHKIHKISYTPENASAKDQP